MKRKISLLLLLLFSIPSMAQSLEEEIMVGEKADKFIKKHYGVYEDEKLQGYVEKVGKSLLKTIVDPEFEYHFTVLDDPMLNAFALPGGYVYVTRGMLAYLDSEAALAGVLGHEVGHVIGHHSYKQMKKSLGDTLLIFAGLGASMAAGGGGKEATAWVAATSQISTMARLGYGRELELQADEFGMIYAYDAGYDPREHAKMFRTLQFKERVSGTGYHGFMSTHPDSKERIIKTSEKSAILVNRGKAVETYRERYLDNIKGLVYGKVDRKTGEKPKYELDIYTVKEGDDFRKMAQEVTGDESMAFEIAVMNSMKEDEAPKAGTRVKVPVKREIKETDPLLRRP